MTIAMNDSDSNSQRPSVKQIGTSHDGSTLIQVGHDLIHNQQRLLSSIDVTDEARDGAKVFEPPPLYRKAVEVLEGTRQSFPVVVLESAVGTGRRSTALSLLNRGNPEIILDLITDWQRPRTNELPCEKNGRYLLDLTFEPDTIAESFARELQDFASRLQRFHARLIIVVTSERWRLCLPLASNITIDPGIPKPLKVLIKRLEAAGSPHTLVDLRNRVQISEVLDDLEAGQFPPQRAAELASTLASTVTLDEATASRINDEYFRWRSYLDQQLGKLRDVHPNMRQNDVARQRALLIAAAALDGADAEAVLTSSDYLLHNKKAKPQPADLLAGPELSGLLESIEAIREGDLIFLTRRRRGLDQAILDRIWTERPQLRSYLLDWLADITGERKPAVEYLDQISRVLVRLAKEHRSIEVLDVVFGWLDGRQQHRRLSIELLDGLATSADIGPAVRRRLYQAASSASTSPEALAGIAEVCARQFGRKFPTMALTRLRLLLDHSSGKAKPSALSALRLLALVSEQMRQLVVRQTLDWFGSKTTQAAGSFALTTLLDARAKDATIEGVLIDVVRHDELSRRIVDGFTKLIGDEQTRPRAFELADAMLKQADAERLDRSAVLDLLTPAIQPIVQEDDVASLLLGAAGCTQRELFRRLVQINSPLRVSRSEV
ncbi:hypothetical protein [Actinoplanes aureus]|uniref:Uncharacterized protein n=1 Tax=Actinoplanes aureus TaxID=2792083 RepID=A0A931G2Q2_9ACTN|nr:hypothetical protein [Actinoplanes aureus]MBG0568410.1 hypothetical protein [Actinoplanes aureus]